MTKVSESKRIRLTPDEKLMTVRYTVDPLTDKTYFGLILPYLSILNIFKNILVVSKFINNFINNDANKCIIQRIFKNQFNYLINDRMTVEDIKILLTTDIKKYFIDIIYKIPMGIIKFHPLPTKNIFEFVMVTICKLYNSPTMITHVVPKKIGKPIHIYGLLSYYMYQLNFVNLPINIKKKHLLDAHDMFLWYDKMNTLHYSLYSQLFYIKYLSKICILKHVDINELFYYTFNVHQNTSKITLQFTTQKEFYQHFVNKQFELILLNTQLFDKFVHLFFHIIVKKIVFDFDVEDIEKHIENTLKNIEFCTQIIAKNKKLKQYFDKFHIKTKLNNIEFFKPYLFTRKQWNLLQNYTTKIQQIFGVKFADIKDNIPNYVFIPNSALNV